MKNEHGILVNMIHPLLLIILQLVMAVVKCSEEELV
jgi:hypothetical protein